VFRLTRDRLEALKTLSRATRIRQSEYLREAIADVLSKHGAPVAPYGVPPQA
jgi:predicted DNA-binding protein